MSKQGNLPRRPGDVYFFATCVVDQFFPSAGMDAITLLEREGIRVHFPEEQTCCGQPAHTSGFPDEARKVDLGEDGFVLRRVATVPAVGNDEIGPYLDVLNGWGHWH